MPKGKHIKSNQERRNLFFSYLRVNEKGCWVWIGDKMSNGYGRLEIDKKKVPAHRYWWIENYGPIPAGMEVAHTCDDRSCSNLDHLWLATHAENMADMKKKGRARNQYTGKLPQEETGERQYGPLPKPAQGRFEAYVNVEGPVMEGMDDRCHLWTGTTQHGYPVFAEKPNEPGGIVKAHRYSFNLKNKRKLKRNERTRRICNHPLCVKASHIERVKNKKGKE